MGKEIARWDLVISDWDISMYESFGRPNASGVVSEPGGTRRILDEYSLNSI